MAYWYKDKKEEWREFISLISQETGQDILMIEKDTIQSILLDKLFASNESLVFKGGTSLSKGYGIIDRFSEDIGTVPVSAMLPDESDVENKETKINFY